jgi:NAD/NADP transhydrogenase alpha subunit
MKIAVAKEIDPSEPRVAASPDTVKKFKAVCTENLIRVDDVMESPKLAE